MAITWQTTTLYHIAFGSFTLLCTCSLNSMASHLSFDCSHLEESINDSWEAIALDFSEGCAINLGIPLGRTLEVNLIQGLHGSG